MFPLVRLRLHDLVETEDSLETGDLLGELEITEDGVDIWMEDAERRIRLAQVLEEGLTLRVGDPTGDLLITVEKPVSPGDIDYATALRERLEKPDLRLYGEVVDQGPPVT